MDLLGNRYVLSPDRTELVKYNSEGKMINRYSNLSLGIIHSVDVSNPLRILVFYRQRQALVFLDSQLSQNGNPIYLEQSGLQSISLVCSSSMSNGFWVFNESNFELYRFNSDNTMQIRTGNLKNFIPDQFHPDDMQESNSQLYLKDSLNGIYVFDLFGTHRSTIPIKIKIFFTVQDNILTYLDNGKITQYHLRLKSFQTFQKEYPGSKKVFFNQNKTYLVFPDSVIVCEE
jgi:hypothetical protein